MHDIQTDKQRAATVAAPTRRKTSNVRSTKAVRELRATVAQIDALLPALVDKPSKQADLLCEKASAIKILISLDTEERETDQDIRIKELETVHETDARRITELTEQNQVLQAQASKTPTRITVPEPINQSLKEERDLLLKALDIAASMMSEEDKAEVAVKSLMTSASLSVGKSLCRLLGIDHQNLAGYLAYSESELTKIRELRNANGILARAVLAVKYPAPVKPQGPAVFIPDTRSAEEKLREAKASVRQSWTHL